MKKCNLLDVIKAIEAIHLNITVPRDQKYKNAFTKIKYICKYHGEQTATPNNLKNGKGCPDCGRENMIEKQKSNFLDVIKDIEFIHPNITVPRDQDYKGALTKIKYNCNIHGEHMAAPAQLKSGRGCPNCGTENCARKLKSNWLDIVKDIESIHPNITIPRDQEYINNSTKIKYFCDIHGEKIAISASLKRGSGCKECGFKKISTNKKSNWLDVIKAIQAKHSNITVPIDQEYKGGKINIKFICKDHGEQMGPPNKLILGQNCIECSNELKLSTKKGWSEGCRKNKNKPIMYWIKMKYGNDIWYKFGRTYRGIKRRFSGSQYKDLEIQTLKIISGEPENIWDLENHIHGFYGKYQYIPDEIEFGGDHECYKFKKPRSDIEIELINLINEFQKNNDCNFLVSDAAYKH